MTLQLDSPYQAPPGYPKVLAVLRIPPSRMPGKSTAACKSHHQGALVEQLHPLLATDPANVEKLQSKMYRMSLFS